MASDTLAHVSPRLDAPITAPASPAALTEALPNSQSQDDSLLSMSSQQDGEKHPKGKRKRTAAKDKMILEEAYNTNPKPDKQARLDIVERVSLNEKEVQIWFQNRRQNDRRKSRPLSAEEVASMRYSGANNPFSSLPTDASIYAPHQHHQKHSSSESTQAETSFYSSPGQAGSGAPSSLQHSTPLHPSQEGQLQQYPSSAESAASAPVGYLANRWNVGTSFSTPSTAGRHHVDDSLQRDDSFACSPDTSFQSTNSQPGNSKSNVRLSLSLEGKAELVPALSPDRISGVDALPPRAPLQRSQSAVTLPPFSSIMKDVGTAPTGRRPSFRRSRDVAAWVSAARAEPCDELTAQAENESNGSAIAAISLLRSSSAGLVTMTTGNMTKRSAPLSTSRSNQIRHREGDDDEPAKKRRMIARAASSIARLETTEIASTGEEDASLEKESPHDRLKVARLLSPTDSDKENLSPDEDGNPRSGGIGPRRPLPTPTATATKPLASMNPRRTAGRILQENGASLLNARANTAPSGLKRGGKAQDASVDIFEDGIVSAKKAILSPGKQRMAGRGGKEDDVDVFMRGEVSPSKKPDMDCVAGLLSLSQGAWR